MTRPAGSDALIAQAKLDRDPVSVSKLVYDNATVVPLWLNPKIVALDKSVQDSGWFINGDSNNNMFGTS